VLFFSLALTTTVHCHITATAGIPSHESNRNIIKYNGRIISFINDPSHGFDKATYNKTSDSGGAFTDTLSSTFHIVYRVFAAASCFVTNAFLLSLRLITRKGRKKCELSSIPICLSQQPVYLYIYIYIYVYMI
jgi:hypothetical protein